MAGGFFLMAKRSRHIVVRPKTAAVAGGAGGAGGVHPQLKWIMWNVLNIEKATIVNAGLWSYARRNIKSLIALCRPPRRGRWVKGTSRGVLLLRRREEWSGGKRKKKSREYWMEVAANVVCLREVFLFFIGILCVCVCVCEALLVFSAEMYPSSIWAIDVGG